MSSHYYFENLRNSPGKVRSIESQISELRAEKIKLQAELEKAQTQPVAIPNSPAAQPSQAAGQLQDLSLGASAPPPGPIIAHLSGINYNQLNSLQLLSAADGSFPDPSTLKFQLVQPKARWNGKLLNFKYAVQYAKDDGGNQQGRIIILARGKDQFFVHPKGSIQIGTAGPWLASEKGEYFSVSRYREGQAQFGPAISTSSIEEIWILFFDLEKHLLKIESVPVSATPAKGQVDDSPEEPNE